MIRGWLVFVKQFLRELAMTWLIFGKNFLLALMIIVVISVPLGLINWAWHLTALVNLCEGIAGGIFVYFIFISSSVTPSKLAIRNLQHLNGAAKLLTCAVVGFFLVMSTCYLADLQAKFWQIIANGSGILLGGIIAYYVQYLLQRRAALSVE